MVAACGAATASAQRTENRSIELLVGEQTSIPAEGIRNYSEGTPGIIDVRVATDGSRFILVALRPGQTTLLLIRNDGSQVLYRVTVRAADQPSQSGVGERDNIRLDFFFLQLDETHGYQIGVGWPASIGGEAFRLSATYDLLGPRFANAQAVVTGQVLPRIDLLEASGWARVLRHATVVTANESEAAFESGGEINVAVEGALSGEIRTIEFGSRVEVLPRYDRDSGRVELRIVARVSDLSDDRGTGIPGRILNEVRTLVNLEMGQAVMLGGLVADTAGASRAGLPGLSQIPIVGILFGTHAGRREARQNVLFIVPSVVDVASLQARQRIEEAMRVYWDYAGGLDELVLMPTTELVPSTAHPDSRAPRARRRNRGQED